MSRQSWDESPRRAGWDSYFLEIAKTVATRSTCPRKHVGAVLVKDRRILATGYNGSMPGELHCEDKVECTCKNDPQTADNIIPCSHCRGWGWEEPGCLIENNHCVRTVHAEANAIAQAAKLGIPVDGATMYVTITPCWACFKLARSAGVREFVIGEEYPPPGPPDGNDRKLEPYKYLIRKV